MRENPVEDRLKKGLKVNRLLYEVYSYGREQEDKSIW